MAEDRMLSDEILLALIKKNSGGGGGTTDYEDLNNLPQINGVTLSGDKSASDLSLASLDANGKVPSSQLPSYVDDVVEGYYDASTDRFYEDSTFETVITPVEGKSWVDIPANKSYRWTGSVYVRVDEGVQIGETSDTAYAGNKGKANADAIAAIKDGHTIDSFADVETALSGKQDTLTFDDIPTDNSNNPVKSNGIYDALATKQNATDNSLQTTDKTVVGAINEHEGDIDSLKSGLTTLDTEVNGDATVYPYADVITIEDAVPANLADCSVKIEPVQDLHGYDHPWVGGAGKNKLPMTVDSIKALNTGGTWSGNDYTVNNVTFTILTDDADNVIGVNVNGTANANVGFKLFQTDSVSAFDGMVLNGCPNDGSLSKYRIAAAGYNSGTFVKDYNNLGSDVTLTLTADNVDSFYVSITAFQGYNIQNVKFYPMIRLATETDATFAPYTNICPISGHTEVDVQVTDGDETTKTYTIALGSTIYGGTVDFDSGVMTASWKSVNLGSYNWGKVNSEFFCAEITDFKQGQTESGLRFGNIICSDYDGTDHSVIRLYFEEWRSFYRLFITDPTKADMTESEFKTAMDGVQFCYELATPTTIQLTPQQIQLLQGQNTLTASTGQISVTVNGVSGSIGAVQEQVNELAEDVAEIKPLNYSTTEQATGQKWIDGKEIYTITVVLESSITINGGQWGATPLSAVNIDTITSVTAKSGNLVFGVIGAAIADGYVNLMNNSGNSMSIDTFTIWYTKTT